MFLQSSNYKAVLDSLLQTNPSIDMAVAFWGDGAEKLFDSTHSARLVCNLLSGGTNPAVIEKLLEKPGFELRHHASLHAKVVLGKDSAIVGSANMSTNGLNIEAGEFDGWEEAGIQLDDTQSLQEIRGWFEKIWATGEPIEMDSQLLEKARQNWEKRATTRIRQQQDAKSIFDLSVAALRNSGVYLALWTDTVSAEAEQEMERWNQQWQETSGNTSLGIPGYFEDWESEPSRLEIGQTVISVYVGKRGKVSVQGVFQINEELRCSNQNLLHICAREQVSKLLGMPFGDDEKRHIEEKIKAFKNELKPNNEPIVISLDQFVETTNSL